MLDTDIAWRLTCLRHQIRCEAAAQKLLSLLREIRARRLEEKYSPSQPRAPRGTPTGGQWIDDPNSARQRLLLAEPSRLLVAWMPMGFRKHGIDQAINRGISAGAILNALNNPLKIRPGSSPNSWKYYGADAVVVINPFGEIITVWPN